MQKREILTQLEGGLIVSCQSEPPEPLAEKHMLAAMARAALMGGACGIRANLPHNIRAIREAVDVPVIGIYKKVYQGFEVFITPTLVEAEAVIAGGCPIVAMDATRRHRPGEHSLEQIVEYLRDTYDVLLMADISTVEEGIRAADLGFDFIGTTLSGYTEYSRQQTDPTQPDFRLLSHLATELKNSDALLVAEGRFWQPEQAARALDTGAFAVVVGSAITRPWLITERFVEAMKNRGISS